MKIFLPLIFFSTLFACSPSVRKIDDKVKKEVTYLWTIQRSTSSKINRIHRYFNISVKKKESDIEFVYFNITSSFPITQPDYFDTAYIVLPNQNLNFELRKTLKNIQYQEKIDQITTTTNTKTDVKVENTTTTEAKKVADTETRNKETTTDTKTTSSTTTNTDVEVDSEILDKIKSERQIRVKTSDLKFALKSPSFKIRLYADNNEDFWDMILTTGDLKKLNLLLNNVADINY